MPLRPFSFLNTGAEEPEGRNWRTFDEASKTIVRTDLVFTNGVATPTIDSGTFTLYGPIVFYSLKVTLNNGDGWNNTTTYINMPFPEVRTSGGAFLASSAGAAVDQATGIYWDTTIFRTAANPTRLQFGNGYVNATGANQTFFLSGWYYRG